MKVEADEFDGKVVYGEKKKEVGTGYAGHASQLAPTLAELARLEKEAQQIFLRQFYGKPAKA
jgi:ATP-dependent RNA helicase DDX1